MSGNIKDHILALFGTSDNGLLPPNVPGPVFPGGEVNTASNLGAGLGWFKEKVGVDLRFRSIVSDDPNLLSVYLSPDGNEIHLDVLGTHSSEGLQANYLVLPTITTTALRGPLSFIADGAEVSIKNPLGSGLTVPVDNSSPVYLIGGGGGLYLSGTEINAVATNFKLATGSLGTPGSAIELDYAFGGVNLYATGTASVSADILSLNSRLLNATFVGAATIYAGGAFSITSQGTASLTSNLGDVTFNDRWTPTAIKLSDSSNTSLLTTNKTLLGSINELFNRPSGGEANTASNLGAGTGTFSSKSGVDLRFRSLVAGTNVSLSSTADEITINATGTGESNTASNLGTGSGLYSAKVGVDLRFKTLLAGTGVSLSAGTNEITINSTVTPGESNTASNLGTGQGIFSNKTGVDLQFLSLVGGDNITLSATSQSIRINAAAPGETNTASNLGTGSGIYSTKVGVDLRFKTLLAGTNVTLSAGTNEITINATGGSGEVNTASNLGATGEGVFGSKVGVDLQFKKLKAGTNVSLSSDAESITITASGGGTSVRRGIYQASCLAQVSSTYGMLVKAPTGTGNPGGIAITRGTDTFVNGSHDPFVVAFNQKLKSIHVVCAVSATGLGTVGAAPTCRIDVFKTNLSTRTLLASVQVPLTSGLAYVQTWNNLGGTPAGFTIFHYDFASVVNLYHGEMFGFEFVNENSDNNKINAISRPFVVVETEEV